MRIFIHSLIQGIKNIITYLPVIWNDRQWDYNYLFKLMHRKLELMEKHYDKGAMFIPSPKVTRRIKTCRLLLKRLADEDYYQVNSWFYNKHEAHNADYLQKQDLELLLKYLNKYVLYWWD